MPLGWEILALTNKCQLSIFKEAKPILLEHLIKNKKGESNRFSLLRLQQHIKIFHFFENEDCCFHILLFSQSVLFFISHVYYT